MLQIMLKYTHPIKIVIVDKLFPSGKVVSAGRTEKAKTVGTENLSSPKRLPFPLSLSLSGIQPWMLTAIADQTGRDKLF